MRLGGYEALSLLTAFVGTVEDIVVVLFKMRGTFNGHRAADEIIGSFNFLVAESKVLEDAEFIIAELVLIQSEGFLAEIISEDPSVEDKTNVKCGGELFLNFLQDFIGETLIS